MVKFPSASSGSGWDRNRVHTHSFNWDNSAASHDTNVIRYSMETSAQAPQLGGAARDSSLLLGTLHFHLSVRRVMPLGKDMGWDRCLLAPWPHHRTGCHWSSGHLAHAIVSLVSLSTRQACLVRSGCCQQHHGTFHHSGAGLHSMLSFISGSHSGDRGSAVHRQQVEIVYTDRRDAAAMCCLLQLYRFEMPKFDW